MDNLAAISWRAYLRTFCVMASGALLLVTGLNYVIDPYLTHQWDTPLLQRLRPVREKLSPWGKTYAVAKYRPSILYIGNSRTELGLPTTEPTLFSGHSVFNAALSGASAGDAITMVGHSARVSRLNTVVWGIDAPSFSMVIGSSGLEPELTTAGPLFFTRRALLNIKRGLTLDMTADSLRQITGKFGAVCRSSLAFYGQRDESCIADRIAGWGGTSAAMAPRLREFAAGDGPTPAALHAFEASVSQLCQGGTRVRLYINPTHALSMDVLYWAGKWPAMEAWQRDLAALGQRQRDAGCDLAIVDFSGYNSITSETIPQASHRHDMAYYWEASHYRTNVGNLILQRLFHGATPVPADFGIELQPAMMDDHLARLRASRARYQAEHAQESAFAKAIVDDATRVKQR